jgi:ABC-2 type transport system ATP-binding protein
VSDLAIEVRGLRKSYGHGPEVVKGVDLDVRRGEVFALLGPNGAGKTTTVEILEGFRARTGGSVSVLGHDPAHGDTELRERIGIVLQETGVDPYLDVVEVIDQYRSYFRAPRPTAEILDVVGLAEHARQRVRRLSGGQKRRLDVAIGLAGDPELLFLDEPTTGFDPSARRQAWEVIANLRTLGKTVLLTTHYMDEAQHLADRVAVIKAGEIIEEGPPDELGGRRQGLSRVTFRVPAGSPPLPAPLADAAQTQGDALVLTVEEPLRMLSTLARWADDKGVEVTALEVARPSLEDVYLELTGGAAPPDPPDQTGGARSGRRRRSRR